MPNELGTNFLCQLSASNPDSMQLDFSFVAISITNASLISS